jgi:1-acyl-sn-glycerol-3-phosphate acyltransferase
MRRPFLYTALLSLVRIVLRVYFKRIEISGAENIPAAGPVILAANHPQSITDALVLGASSRRMVHYLAHSGLFRNRLVAWLLGQLGVIPVMRSQEGAPPVGRNSAMFEACHALLARGGTIGIFPEGVSLEERRVQSLKTGTARIGLESESSHAWDLGVRIVPVGLNFESRRRFRSRVLVRFGAPIEVSTYRGDYEADPVETIHQMTTALQEAIRLQVVNIERGEFESLVRDLELVYKGELLGRPDLAIPGGTPLQQGQRVSREIARALDFFLQHRPIVVWRVRVHLEIYRRKLRRLHLQDEQIREQKRRTLPGEMARLLVLGGLGLPVAAYGALWNIVPYKLTGWIARHHATDRTKFHFLQLTIGSAVYLLYYGPLGWLSVHLLGPVGAGVFAATLLPTGLFARAYGAFMMRRRRMLQLAYLDLTHRYAIQRLRQERQRLIAEVDEAFHEYVAVRDATPSTKHPSDDGAAGRGDTPRPSA